MMTDNISEVEATELVFLTNSFDKVEIEGFRSRGFLILAPQATEYYTTEALKKMGGVGVYRLAAAGAACPDGSDREAA